MVLGNCNVGTPTPTASRPSTFKLQRSLSSKCTSRQAAAELRAVLGLVARTVAQQPRLSVDARPRVGACWAAAHLYPGLVSRHDTSRLLAPIGAAQCLLTLIRRSPPLLHPARVGEN